MYLQNYGLRKTWFDKYLKTLTSDDTLTRYMGNRTKQH